MSTSLAEILSTLDNPEDIQKVLEAVDIDTADTPSSTEEPSLSGLFEQFLRRRKDRSPSTIALYKRTIPKFIDFANDHDVTTPIGFRTDLIEAYLDYLDDRYDRDATILTHTKYVRAWLDWLNTRNKCPESIYQVLNQDELGLSPKARDENISADEATHIITQLQNRRRGSSIHALMELLWNGGLRLGGVHSLDKRDFNPELNELLIRHRPETGTYLKNGDKRDGPGDGERNIELHDRVVNALKCYIETERPDVTDETREPLFATEYGRAAKSTLRRWVYEATSCQWADVNASEQHCDGSCHPNSNVCPHSYFPHAIRRGAIVNHLSGGLRIDRASERFDVSIQILKKHYDPRDKRKQKNDRADAVRDAWSD